MKKLLFISVVLMILTDCLSQNLLTGKQGISGEIRWVEGNFMPAVGDTSYVNRAKSEPVKRVIYIYMATKRDEANCYDGVFYTDIKTELIRKIKSNIKGKFQVTLPPGKYSLFVKEKDGLFANTFDGENYINPVTVQPDKFTEIQILVNYRAFY